MLQGYRKALNLKGVFKPADTPAIRQQKNNEIISKRMVNEEFETI